jgi:hypothetical protein
VKVGNERADPQTSWRLYIMPTLPLIVFGVNETLLDPETMAPIIERIFDDKAAMRLWFSNLIHSRSP